jgi:hypothetical protein
MIFGKRYFLAAGKKLMFQYVDHFDQREHVARNDQTASIDAYVENGRAETTSRLICCNCAACNGIGRTHALAPNVSACNSVDHAYRLVVRIIQSNELLLTKKHFGIPSHIHVRKGIPRFVVWGNDVGEEIAIEPLNGSKIEENRSVPSVLQDLVIRLQKSLPHSRQASRTLFASRTTTDGSTGRFMTLSQFKSILSDNRKHARSVWNHVSHITLCPWAGPADDWMTVILKYDPEESPTNESPEVSICRTICDKIKSILLESGSLKIVSGRFTFYRELSDDPALPWWLGDVSELKVTTIGISHGDI